MSSAAAPTERLDRSETLRTQADYQRCYKGGSRRSGALTLIVRQPNPLGHARIGLAVSRKVGGAVVRNRLKRWTRELFRRSPLRATLPAIDIVVQPKPPAGAASFDAWRNELERLLFSSAGGGKGSPR